MGVVCTVREDDGEKKLKAGNLIIFNFWFGWPPVQPVERPGHFCASEIMSAAQRRSPTLLCTTSWQTDVVPVDSPSSSCEDVLANGFTAREANIKVVNPRYCPQRRASSSPSSMTRSLQYVPAMPKLKYWVIGTGGRQGAATRPARAARMEALPGRTCHRLHRAVHHSVGNTTTRQ